MRITYRVGYPKPDFDGQRQRPYLALHLTGLNGVSQSLRGLVDSGADYSFLPSHIGRLFGYTYEMLRPCSIRTGSGDVDGRRADKPVSAFVVGSPEMRFQLMPVFIVDGPVVWGRADFYDAFEAVCIHEHGPDPAIELSFEDPAEG